MTEQSKYFVKYRMKNGIRNDHYITFSSEKTAELLKDGRFPIVNNLREINTEVADKVEKLLHEMTQHEKQFFTWLGADASHMEYFMKDPTGVLQQAVPVLSDSFFQELNLLPKLLLGRE